MKANVEQPDRGEAERFLAALDPIAKGFTFQIFDDNKDRDNDKLARVFNGSLNKFWPELVKRNKNRVGIFITVNETNLKGREAKNVIRVRALFVDLDGAPLEPVLRGMPKPHLVVESSPGRYHVYWFVTGIALEQFEELQKRLIKRFNGDPKVKDLPRVLRLPGFYHQKGERFLSRIISIQDHPHYTAADFSNSDAADFFTAYGEEFREPIDVEQKLADMQYHGQDGNGIDCTETSVSAALLLKYQPVTEDVIKQVVEEIIDAVKATPGTESFNWEREAKHIRKKCLKWIEKRPEIANPAWLKKHFPKLADKEVAASPPPPAVDPLDLWGHYEPPEFPLGLLPDVIERYSLTMGKLMGADPAGLAMSALAVCGAMIPASIKIKVKRHADWFETANLWVGLIGGVSALKSPTMQQAIKPVRAIERTLWQAYASEMRSYEAMTADERKEKDATKPRLSQLRLEDTTIEGAQDTMRNNPHGMLNVQDELGAFFGSMDRYSGGKGASNRGFWLQTWKGDGYTVNRVGRGVFYIDNIGISLLGGIQPEVIQKVSGDNYDDGLVQRLLPIVLRPGALGHDDPTPPVSNEYARLIDHLYDLRPEVRDTPDFFLPPSILEFDDDAQVIRREVEKRNLELGKLELINRKLGSHCGKLNGYFSRLCLIWHCIENHDVDVLPDRINADTARRVARFMREFLLPHALAFYAGILNLADDHDHLTSIAGFILARGLKRVTTRDVAHGDRTMRKLTRRDTENVLEQLDALAWVTRVPGPRPSSPPQWIVNPRCHELYAERAEAEAARRSEVRAIMVDMVKKV